jgi:hypothetical protein
MASITINKFTGKGVTFAFAMVSSYTLAVVREGDLPVIIPPWTLEPVKLQPYEPARPYFFLVQKPLLSSVWQSLYFVLREDIGDFKPVDMPGKQRGTLHVSTTTCSGTPGKATTVVSDACTSTTAAQSVVALCPKDHFTRPFQMRAMCGGFLRPVETNVNGLFRCGGGCSGARNQLVDFVGRGRPGSSGFFYLVDDSWLCKVATDESVPAVFAVLPAVVNIPIDQNYAKDQTLAATEYVETYYITSTIDRCVLMYHTTYSEALNGGTDPVLVPQVCVKDMSSLSINTGGIGFVPLQATYARTTDDSAYNIYICDANTDTGKGNPYNCKAYATSSAPTPPSNCTQNPL